MLDRIPNRVSTDTGGQDISNDLFHRLTLDLNANILMDHQSLLIQLMLFFTYISRLAHIYVHQQRGGTTGSNQPKNVFKAS